MTSPRFQGPAEKMGNVTPLRANDLAESIPDSELEIRRLLDGVNVGTVALLDTEFTLKSAQTTPVRATFVDKAELGYGRDEFGRHEPRFGQMLINGAGLHERPLLVAVKPFAKSTDQFPKDLLTREWAASNYLNSLTDRQLAYLPLGVWRNAKGVNHLITLYEHGVVSYDNVFWADKELSPEALRPKAIEHAFEDCISGLGFLHGAGLVHTDAEAKNLAGHTRLGKRFIDLESMTLLPRTGTEIENTDKTRRLLRGDLETFLDSTMQVEANRNAIAGVLAKRRMDDRLAKLYRAGLREAKGETGLRMPDTGIATPAYFKTTIDVAMEKAKNTPDEVDERY